MFDVVIRALADSDHKGAQAAFGCEERLNAMEKQFRESHLRRLADGDCNFYSGLTFVDCIYNYEKIGDHLVNTAQAVLGDFQWGEKFRMPGRQQGADASGQPEALKDDQRVVKGVRPDRDTEAARQVDDT